MYHAEGYLDHSTYFVKGHIWNFQIARGKKLCYFWCVLKEGVKEDGTALAKRLSGWIMQELTLFLDKEQLGIQKELKRLGEHLNACKTVYGLREIPMLHLYFQGKLYHYGTEKNELKSELIYRRNDFGVYVAMALTEPGLTTETLRANSIISKAKKSILMTETTIEEAANRLKTDLLCAMSTGKLEWGYFLLWEDNYAF